MLEDMRKLRKAKGLSMKRLGEIVGVTEAAISHYEKGNRDPSLEAACLIADALGVSLDRLVLGIEKEPSPEDRERLEVATVNSLDSLSPEERKIALAVLAALHTPQNESDPRS